ncbi:MAG TPA: PEP-CTERM sorting domain-containing protein [Candidatus Acidoferrales bacterium]|nr:PEP-CTERM sorting domain-containing protein [Candidatus Acidoferrales bacterium]
MTNIKKAVYALMGCSLLFLLSAGPAKAGICPAVGIATDCGALITVTSQSGGVASAFSVANLGNGNPFDDVEDTLVGITNNSGATINSITLNASDNTFGGLGNFDGDGVCLFDSTLCLGTTGYEGPNMTFSAGAGCPGGLGTIGCDSVVVTFTGGLADGASTWFSLEGTPDSLTGGGGIGGPTPEPTSLLLLGTGLVGLALRRFMA